MKDVLVRCGVQDASVPLRSLAALALGLLLVGCHPDVAQTDAATSSVPVVNTGENPASVSGLNYASYGVATFSITDAEGRSGGGPNLAPVSKTGEPSGGGSDMCCVYVPQKWHDGMTVHVRWRRDTHPYDDDRSGDQWLEATAKVPPYGPKQYNFIVQFLEDDRVRVRVDDGSPLDKPARSDRYIVQGVLDAKANAQMQALRERDKAAAAYDRRLQETVDRAETPSVKEGGK
ncbi:MULTISPECIES: DUF3304 domain-containing protein [unclassified Paraburkholderia]|uniref:DUF3304 domain-containing protein n=1 Tax=unclassified Paraburkholderia TaxID=2615204 RepID=UPI002AB2FDFD|nr:MULTISPECIES: DUF3304 domain-containing protein [unclassified Paraburkholderia]